MTRPGFGWFIVIVLNRMPHAPGTTTNRPSVRCGHAAVPATCILRLPLAADDDASVLAALRNHPDASPARELIIEMPPKITVRIIDGTVTATAGQTELKLDQSGSSGGTVHVKAGRTTVTMDQDGDVTLESAGSVTLKAAADLTIQAGGSVEIKAGTTLTAEAGTRATLKGSLTAALEGGAGASVQGASVTIQGQTSFSP